MIFFLSKIWNAYDMQFKDFWSPLAPARSQLFERALSTLLRTSPKFELEVLELSLSREFELSTMINHLWILPWGLFYIYSVGHGRIWLQWHAKIFQSKALGPSFQNYRSLWYVILFDLVDKAKTIARGIAERNMHQSWNLLVLAIGSLKLMNLKKLWVNGKGDMETRR